jgi:RNA polymerase primary sigma factor
MTRALADQGRNIRIPGHMMEIVNRIHRVERELSAELGRDPSPEEVAERSGISVDRLLEVAQITIPTASLDAPVGSDSDDLTVGDMIANPNSANDPQESTERMQLIDAIAQTLRSLPPRDQEILAMRFGIDKYAGKPHTLEDVAKEMKVTRERVRQIEQKTLTRLRHPHNSANLRAFLDGN